jgi:hypothetical protein
MGVLVNKVGTRSSAVPTTIANISSTLLSMKGSSSSVTYAWMFAMLRASD